MKQIAERANNLVKDLQIIADTLSEYNPRLCKKKVPLSAIQFDLACLGRELTWLYAEIGKRIRDENNANNDL